MRPENALDWIAFVFLLMGAFAWGYHVTEVNILGVTLGRIWTPLYGMVLVLIAASGAYWLRRVFPPRRAMDRGEERGKGHGLSATNVE